MVYKLVIFVALAIFLLEVSYATEIAAPSEIDLVGVGVSLNADNILRGVLSGYDNLRTDVVVPLLANLRAVNTRVNTTGRTAALYDMFHDIILYNPGTNQYNCPAYGCMDYVYGRTQALGAAIRNLLSPVDTILNTLADVSLKGILDAMRKLLACVGGLVGLDLSGAVGQGDVQCNNDAITGYKNTILIQSNAYHTLLNRITVLADVADTARVIRQIIISIAGPLISCQSAAGDS